MDEREKMKFTNRLVNESSLYLRQHAHNPVDWFPWGDEALTKAVNEDKLLFVSIGYSSCHWCHVMEKESFESEEIADYLNQHFVSIKVDREERPDLDHIYMDALQNLTGQGGWPLNIFLTPDQKPFFGGTYFPNVPKYGRPSFLQILERIQQLYVEKRSELEETAHHLTESISQEVFAGILPMETNQLSFSALLENIESGYEPRFGGFSESPKFPQPLLLEAALRLAVYEDSAALSKKLEHTLENMAIGGFYDLIGGGFHRYSTDDEWLVPHFEKMLYDNALLLSVYALAFRISGNKRFEEVARKTYQCLESDFALSGGGFASAWDADSDGEEGAFYVWTYHELKEVLTEKEFNLLENYCTISIDGNWEQKLILRLKSATITLHNEAQSQLEDVFFKLKQIRSKRIPPQRDEKRVLSWNALVLQAYFNWYLVSGDEEVKHRFLNEIRLLMKQKNPVKDYERVSGIRAFGNDLAEMGLALIRAFQLSGDDSFMDEAKLIAEEIRKNFFDVETNSFTMAAKTHSLIHNPKELFDQSEPSTQAAATRFFFELGYFTGSVEYTTIAEKALQAVTKLVNDYPSYCASSLNNAILMKENQFELVITGGPLFPFADTLSAKQFISAWLFETDELVTQSKTLVLQNKKVINEQVTAYWCERFNCKLPVHSTTALKNLIEN